VASVAPSAAPSASASASQAAAGGVNSDLAKAVQDAFAAIQTGGVAAAIPLTCAAKQAEAAQAFAGASATSLTQLGVKMEDLLSAMKLTWSNLVIKSATATGDKGTVAYSADLKVDLDATKMRAIMKTVLAAKGQPVDDAALDTVMAAMQPQLSKSQHVDDTVDLVKENGKWVMCDS